MAVVDAFQHWLYENPEAGAEPAALDRKWTELHERFIPDIDWSGLEETLKIGWQKKLHIFQVPFYYVEYGLAQLGAVQVWKKSLNDKAKTVADYRKALAMGGTASLPELYAAAGAKFAFDEATLAEAVGLVEQKIADLEK
jgi:oligoendopeptidase F